MAGVAVWSRRRCAEEEGAEATASLDEVGILTVERRSGCRGDSVEMGSFDVEDEVERETCC